MISRTVLKTHMVGDRASIDIIDLLNYFLAESNIEVITERLIKINEKMLKDAGMKTTRL